VIACVRDITINILKDKLLFYGEMECPIFLFGNSFPMPFFMIESKVEYCNYLQT
jgi:hypothetical protein